MRTQHRSILAVAAAATLVSGAALATAPAALAAPASVQGAPSVQSQDGPVSITLSGLPGALNAGAAPVEFTATLKNSADHPVDATTGLTVADVDSGIKETQLKLEYRSPGSTQWKDAALSPGQRVGAVWELDTFATRVSVPAGGSVAYRLRLSVAADARGGTATAGFRAVVSDPTLPPEQRTTTPSSEYGRFTVVPVGGPPTTPPVPAPGLPDVSVVGMPASFAAGGGARQFKLVIANHSGKDVRVVPEVALQGANVLPAEAVRFEFRTAAGEWLDATVFEPEQVPQPRLILALRSGDKEADLVRLHDGESRTIDVRLAFAKEAPAGAESLVLTGVSLPAAGGTGVSAVGPAVDFRIVAAGASGTPSSPGTATTAPVTSVPGPSVPSAPGSAQGTLPTSGAPVVPAAVATTEAPGRTAVAAVTAAPVAVPVATPTSALATTGGTSSAPMAITGATAIALGLGLLVVAYRRRYL